MKILPGITADYILTKTPQQVIANTLQGSLISLIKKHGPQSESALIKLLQPTYDCLRKPNGETIKADLSKSVSMVLKSSKAFTKVDSSFALAQPGCASVLKSEYRANVALRM